MNIKDGQNKQYKHKIEEYKKHPMINLADSINRSKIGELSEFAKESLLAKVITAVIVIGILFFISR